MDGHLQNDKENDEPALVFANPLYQNTSKHGKAPDFGFYAKKRCARGIMSRTCYFVCNSTTRELEYWRSEADAAEGLREKRLGIFEVKSAAKKDPYPYMSTRQNHSSSSGSTSSSSSTCSIDSIDSIDCTCERTRSRSRSRSRTLLGARGRGFSNAMMRRTSSNCSLKLVVDNNITLRLKELRKEDMNLVLDTFASTDSPSFEQFKFKEQAKPFQPQSRNQRANATVLGDEITQLRVTQMLAMAGSARSRINVLLAAQTQEAEEVYYTTPEGYG